MYQLKAYESALVVVDVQERLAPAMDNKVYERIKQNIIKLIKGFNIVDVPVFHTQQYSKGLGNTVPEIAELIENQHFEKVTFSCCGEKSFIEELKNAGVSSVVLTGMETHVCVLQTAIDLLQEGFKVHIAADAVCSRAKFNWEIGLRYMEKAGAIVTVTETVLFQLLEKAGTDEFKQVSKLVK
ncbi:hydrolase [Limisalsivibrio acetivorans]|uniref:hydrolase n=1 Tax=Limisalsivibrio acetivorans TaxID=1304888 RepID=UPI0003B607AC|nr:hydrolase [Limisalsivibrio acetivorans]